MILWTDTLKKLCNTKCNTKNKTLDNSRVLQSRRQDLNLVCIDTVNQRKHVLS